MMKYKIIESWVGPMQKLTRTIVNLENGAIFPDNADQNSDYQKYIAWVQEGNVAPVEDMPILGIEE